MPFRAEPAIEMPSEGAPSSFLTVTDAHWRSLHGTQACVGKAAGKKSAQGVRRISKSSSEISINHSSRERQI